MYYRVCKCCGKDYSTGDNRSIFCSLPCSREVNNIKQRLIHANQAVKFKFCVHCNKSFSFKYSRQNFCSHKCSATHFNKKRRITKKCLMCGNVIKQNSMTYCSNKCKKDSFIKDWIEGKIVGYTKYGSIKDWVRHYLYESCDNKCSKCGFSATNPFSNKTILQVDHIDGDCFNATRDNLQVVCPNCHAMTSTYGRLNKNGKRSWKRHFYKVNKLV